MGSDAKGRDEAGPAGDAGAMPKQYRPTDHEDRVRARWDRQRAFFADPSRVGDDRRPYTILIPPPNVTAALHLGHALNNTLQDVLARAHRMRGFETLWMPGTDHAGIATQTVVEKRVMAEEGKRRTDFAREAFIEKVQAYKDEYEARITDQLKRLGCSCDWDRQRFTMDPVCARAVHEAFFRLFRDGLIYRGKRLVNWDPVTQTALADDEVEMHEVEGKFYYLRYPLAHPWDHDDEPTPVTWSELAARGYPGADAMPDEERAWVTVATTRPETYLGDTGVAVNPRDPRAGALVDLCVELPIVGRAIPIVQDDYVVMPDPESDDAKARYATGFLKVTPAHDPNDWEIGQRHKLKIINVLGPDASISATDTWDSDEELGNAHVFMRKSREEARELVAKEFKARGLLEAVKPYRHSVGHSYRSHVPIEPYLSDQWYVKVTDERLRGAALNAMAEGQRGAAYEKGGEGESEDGINGRAGREESVEEGRDGRDAHPTRTNRDGDARPTRRSRDGDFGDGALRFYPDRYARTFEHWHENLRDWCISRQLWWGHRIPVWTRAEQSSDDRSTGISGELSDNLRRWAEQGRIAGSAFGSPLTPEGTAIDLASIATPRDDGMLSICVRNPDDTEVIEPLEAAGFVRDPDVLDTWFSSALWPLSTMGWPDAEAAARHTGLDDFPGLLRAFNPTSVLSTGRDITTLWVSRMVMFNRYFLPEQWPEGSTDEDGHGRGPVPFHDVFIHAMIQDGEGRKMSKSLGNGVDPLDIIHSHGADALRYTLCHMTTQTQDVRMPVIEDPETGRNTSPKFDLGRNFCNKLWNASRFAISTLDRHAEDNADSAAEVDPGEAMLADRWILSRLATTIEAADSALGRYQFSQYAQTLYDFVWRDLCDWYLEAVKPTIVESPAQRAVLRTVLDASLRLLHPVMPYITEAIHETLRTQPGPSIRGLDLGAVEDSESLLCRASWPMANRALVDSEAMLHFERLRAVVSAVREVRAQHSVPPKRRITLHCPEALHGKLTGAETLLMALAGLDEIHPSERGAPDGAVACRVVDEETGHEMLLSNLADAVDTKAERQRLEKQVADLDRSIKSLEGRLANPGYTQKAPAHLVEQTQQQLETARQERAAAAEAMERLG